MHYLEHLVELFDDLPDELEKRLSQVRKWDEQVEKLRSEMGIISNVVFEPSTCADNNTKEERERLVMSLAEKQSEIRTLANKKLDLISRTENVLEALHRQVTESTYHYKIELEVDNPGCTESIEMRFCRAYDLQPSSRHLVDCNVDFEPASVCSSMKDEPLGISPGRPSGRTRNPFKERTNKDKGGRLFGSESASSSRAASPAPHKGRSQGTGEKKKVLSNYMRKKFEKQRIARLTQETHLRRQEEKRQKAESSSLKSSTKNSPSYDLLGSLGADDAFSLGRDSVTSPQDMWNNDSAMGSEDDFDPTEAMDLFPMLPSPPREIMEDDSLFGMTAEDDGSTGDLMLEDMDAAITGADESLVPFSQHHHRAEKRKEIPASGALTLPEPKKKAVPFVSTSEKSIHGRPRKLTGRAAELVQAEKARMKEKTRREQLDVSAVGAAGAGHEVVDVDDDGSYCFCKQPKPESDFIMCESGSCPIVWFHYVCVGITEAPEGDWFCTACRDKQMH